jgi:hypothetical protein
MHPSGPGPSHLYLIPGFDPHGSRTVMRLLREALQAVDPVLRLKRLGHRGSISRWQIRGGNRKPLRQLTVLSWNDIVRRRWAQSPWQLLVRGAALYPGHLPRLLAISLKHPKVSFTLIWPMLFWVAISLAAAVSARLVTTLPLQPAIQLPALVAVLGGWWLVGIRQAKQRRLGWLWRAIDFSAALGRGEESDLAQRLDRFARQISEDLVTSQGGPITVVGHSTGSYLSLHLMERLRQSGVLSRWPGAVQLLTLGHNPAVLALFNPQGRTAANATALLECGLAWCDLTCPDDWMSFAQVDLLQVLDRPRASGLQRRRARLAQAAGLKGTMAVLNHQFVLHFQYFRHGPAEEYSLLQWLLPEWPMAAAPAQPQNWRRDGRHFIHHG